MDTVTLYHGSRRSDWAPHEGACLVDSEAVARAYARVTGTVYAVTVDLSALSVDDVTDDVRRDDGYWPGDAAADRARLVAAGLDAVEYDDETESGRAHRCVRLLSGAALAAVVAVEVHDGPEDEE